MQTSNCITEINDQRIYNYYKENQHIDIIKVNHFILDAFESMNNMMSSKSNESINAQLLAYIKMNTKDMQDIKQKQEEHMNQFLIHYTKLKNEYLEDMKQIITCNTLTANEKITSVIEKTNNQLIDKTQLLLNDTLPKSNDQAKKELQHNINNLSHSITQELHKIIQFKNNDSEIKEFIKMFDSKYTQMIQNMQQPLFSLITSCEERTTKNIDSLKDIHTISLQTQQKTTSDITDFLGKYKNSSNKGKFGEHQLQSILNSLFPNGEIINTTGQKESGDFIIRRFNKPTILIENKDYDGNIPKEEITKFIRDVETNNMSGIFISQKSAIPYKDNFQIDFNKGNIIVYIQNCDYNPDKIRIAIDMIDHMANKLQEAESDNDADTIPKDVLNSINLEFKYYISNRENLQTAIREIQKRLQSILDEMRFPELEKYLSNKYAYAKTSNYVCDVCNIFSTGTKQSLSAHKRGCVKRYNNLLNSSA